MTELNYYQLGVELGEHMKGTCQSSIWSMQSLNQNENLFNNATFCRGFDDTVFMCDGCEWWTDTEEMNNDGDERFCAQCLVEREDG
jgi:hypothetical protein